MTRKIDVMIAGAQKAGTTSLKNYLGQHPKIVTHWVREFAFFADDEQYRQGYDKAFREFFPSGPVSGDARVLAKYAGIYVREELVKRLRDHNPKCHIVFLVRNPVDRAYSSYLMEKNWGSKYRFGAVRQAIENHAQGKEDQSYQVLIHLGMYARAIELFYRYFPREQVELFLFRDFVDDPVGVCREVFRRVGVADTFAPDTSRAHNTTRVLRSEVYAAMLLFLRRKDNPFKNLAKKILPQRVFHGIRDFLEELGKTGSRHESMDPQTRNYLVEFFRPHNERLEELIGKDLSMWNR